MDWLDKNNSVKQKLFGRRSKPNLIEIYTGSLLMEIIDVNWTRFGRAAAVIARREERTSEYTRGLAGGRRTEPKVSEPVDNTITRIQHQEQTQLPAARVIQKVSLLRGRRPEQTQDPQTPSRGQQLNSPHALNTQHTQIRLDDRRNSSNRINKTWGKTCWNERERGERATGTASSRRRSTRLAAAVRRPPHHRRARVTTPLNTPCRTATCFNSLYLSVSFPLLWSADSPKTVEKFKQLITVSTRCWTPDSGFRRRGVICQHWSSDRRLIIRLPY